MRIMIVDDEPGLAEAIAGLLRLDGYEVFSATGGGEALEQIATFGAIDLLISDLMMPGLTGMELHQQLQMRGLAPFLFVLMSGAAAASVPRLAGEHQAMALPKPVTADELRTVAARCAEALHPRMPKAS